MSTFAGEKKKKKIISIQTCIGTVELGQTVIILKAATWPSDLEE